MFGMEDETDTEETHANNEEKKIPRPQSWPGNKVDAPQAGQGELEDEDDSLIILRCNKVSDEEEIVRWLEGWEDDEVPKEKRGAKEQERIGRHTHQDVSRGVQGSKNLERKKNGERRRRKDEEKCKERIEHRRHDTLVRAGDCKGANVKQEHRERSHGNHEKRDKRKHGNSNKDKNGNVSQPDIGRGQGTEVSSDVLYKYGRKRSILSHGVCKEREYTIEDVMKSHEKQHSPRTSVFYGPEMEMGRILKQRIDLIMKHYRKIQHLREAFDDVEFIIYTARYSMLREQTEQRVYEARADILPTQSAEKNKINRHRVSMYNLKAATKKNHDRLKEEVSSNPRTLFVIIADECHWKTPDKTTATDDFLSEWSKAYSPRNVVVLQVSAAPINFLAINSCIPSTKCALTRQEHGHEKLIIRSPGGAFEDSSTLELHMVKWKEVDLKNFRKGVRTKLKSSPMVRSGSRDHLPEYLTAQLEGCPTIASTRDPRNASEFTIRGENGVVSLQTKICSTDGSVADYLLAVDGGKLVAQRKEDILSSCSTKFRALLDFGAGLVAFRSLQSEVPNHYICIDARRNGGVGLAVPRIGKKRGVPILQSQSGNPRQQCFVFHMEPCKQVDDGESQYLGLNYYLGTMSKERIEDRKLRDDSFFQEMLMKSQKRFSDDDLLAADYAYHILHRGVYQSTESILLALKGKSDLMSLAIAKYLQQLEITSGCIAARALVFVRKCYVNFLLRKLHNSSQVAGLKYWVACHMHLNKKEREIHLTAGHPLNRVGQEELARDPGALVDMWLKSRAELSETSRIINDLVTSRMSVGEMKILRAKSQKTADFFFDTIKLAQKVAGFEQSFHLIKDYGTQQLENQMKEEKSRCFFKKLQTVPCHKSECSCQEYVQSPTDVSCQRCSHVHKKIHQYVDLQGMPCILLLVGKERRGDTFPDCFNCLDLRISSNTTTGSPRPPNAVCLPTMAQVLGWMCRYVKASLTSTSIVPYALLSWRLCDSLRRSLRESPAFSTVDCLAQPYTSRSIFLHPVSRQWRHNEAKEIRYEERRPEEHTNRLILHAEAQIGKTGSYLYLLKLLRKDITKSNKNDNSKEHGVHAYGGMVHGTRKASLSRSPETKEKGERGKELGLCMSKPIQKVIRPARLPPKTTPVGSQKSQTQPKAPGRSLFGRKDPVSVPRKVSSEANCLGTTQVSKQYQLKTSIVCGSSITLGQKTDKNVGDDDCSFKTREPKSPLPKKTSRQTVGVAENKEAKTDEPQTVTKEETKGKAREEILSVKKVHRIRQVNESTILANERKSEVDVKSAIQKRPSPTRSEDDDGYESNYWSFKRRRQEESISGSESVETKSGRKTCKHPASIKSKKRYRHLGLAATGRHLDDSTSQQTKTHPTIDQTPFVKEKKGSTLGSSEKIGKVHQDKKKTPHENEMSKEHTKEVPQYPPMKRKVKETAEKISISERSKRQVTEKSVPVPCSGGSDFQERSEEVGNVKCRTKHGVASKRPLQLAGSDASTSKVKIEKIARIGRGRNAERKQDQQVAVAHQATKTPKARPGRGGSAMHRKSSLTKKESGGTEDLPNARERALTEETNHAETRHVQQKLQLSHGRKKDNSDYDGLQEYEEILLDNMEDSESSDDEERTKETTERDWRYPAWRDIKETESLLFKSVQKGCARTVTGQIYTHETDEIPVSLSDYGQPKAEVEDTRIAVSLQDQLQELVEPKDCRTWDAGHESHCESCRSWFVKLDDPLALSLLVPLGDEQVTVRLSMPTVAPYADVYQELKENGLPTIKRGALYNRHRPGVKYWVFHPLTRNPRTSLLNYRHVLGKEPASCIQVIVAQKEHFHSYQRYWGKSHMIIELPSCPHHADEYPCNLGCPDWSSAGGIGYARRFIQLFAFALKMEYVFILDDDIMFMAEAAFPSRSERPLTNGTGALVMKRCPFTRPLKVMKELVQGQLAPPVKDFEPYPFECITKSGQAKRYPMYSYTGPAKDIDSAPDKGYALIGMLSRYPKVKRPFSRAHVSGAVLLNVKATVENDVFYRPWPFWDDVRFSDDCDLNRLWVVRFNRFLLGKALNRERIDVDEISGVHEWTEETTLVCSDMQGPTPSEPEVDRLLTHIRQQVQDNDSCRRLCLHGSQGTTDEHRLLTEIYQKLPLPDRPDCPQATSLCFTYSPQHPAASSWKEFADTVKKVRKRVWCVMSGTHAGSAGMTSLRAIRDSGHVHDALCKRESRVRVFTAFNPQTRQPHLLLIDITFENDLPTEEKCDTKMIKKNCETLRTRPTAFEYLESLLRQDGLVGNHA